MAPDRSAFRHGMRVRLYSAHGPKGVLLECWSRGGQPRWMIRLQGIPTRWVEPDDFVVDGPGDFEIICAQCGLRCLTADAAAVLCTRCDAEAFGAAVRDDDPDRPRRVWQRTHRHD